MRKSMALSGMLLAGLLMAPPSYAQTTQGNVDGVSGDGAGAVTLRGWACKVGETLPSARTVTLKLYVGGEAGNGGVELGTYTVNQPSEQAVNDICRNAYLYNRFTIGLSITVRQQYGGQRLYVYADTLVPFGGYQLLPGSGQVTVPEAPAVSDSVYYIHTDRLGSNVIMTDEKANVVAKTDYKAYGSAADQQQKNEAPGYTGHYEDPLTGLTYMQQRYYDADIGRFMSVDPIGAWPADVSRFNRYAYGNNNPLSFIDPTGMASCPMPSAEADGTWNIPICGGKPGGGSSNGGGLPSFVGIGGSSGGGSGGGGVTAPVAAGSTITARPMPRPIEWPQIRPLPFPAVNPLGLFASGVFSAIWPSNGWVGEGTCPPNCYGALSLQYNEEVTPPVPDAVPGRETKGRTKQWEKQGDYADAEKDFDGQSPTDVRELPQGGKVGVLPDGRTILVRPTSSDGRPTLEIQSGKNRIKVRYGL